MSANQFGEFADVSARASSAHRNAARRLGVVNSAPTTSAVADRPSGAGSVSGAKNSTTYSGTPARIPIAATLARPPASRRCQRSPIIPPTTDSTPPSWNSVARMPPIWMADCSS